MKILACFLCIAMLSALFDLFVRITWWVFKAILMLVFLVIIVLLLALLFA